MAIDESINQIVDSLIGKKAYLLDHSDRVALTDALNTMKKYQKIKAIYDKWNVDFGVETHRAMSKIGEILGDGDDN